ncbi:intercompartmental signaling factor BofC [Alkalihalobacillus sp. MEB130]|uniref:intercompartmental signaling factor BofC n=1 Tax=Alkalihalobacillus sp. MEB130 TaxID=2976704 RepID=UPI0028DE49E9|nr:intercompartmental signaling factor BofC [Alkalihalobacillus sp. MEB130]MDT8861981.1 intercompartmental signaling factor BofC [Alkalihalobacillus sp. MEB130]
MTQVRQTQRKHIYSFIISLALIAFGFLLWNTAVIEGSQTKEISGGKNEQAEAFEVMGPQTLNITLERVYLDGEKSQERIQETIWSMEDFWALYEDWTLIDQNQNEMIFRKEVNDISPLLKVNGYFGITEEGILSIYEGSPNEERVIQSFFQLDTAKLKSQQHIELRKGIPVQDLKHYEEVLQVFGQYKSAQL